MSVVKINSGTGSTVTVNKPGAPSTVTVNRVDPSPPEPLSATYPIEYKSVAGDFATAISIVAENDNVDYEYLDENDNVIDSGNLPMDTDRPLSEIKTDVFTSLSLTDLLPISFISAPVANYVAFGNIVHRGNQDYALNIRRGTSHLGLGRIDTQPIDSLTRSFGIRIIIPRTPVEEDLRGGAHCAKGSSMYFFSSLYLPATDTFISLTLNKSTDLTGAAWNESTVLYKVGTNGGVNETTYERFNFYGTPVNIPGTQTWFISWYEHNGAGTWRPNFLKSTDDLVTFTTHNISQSSVFKIGETDISYVGNNTLIALGRPSTFDTLMQNVSTDLGGTWSGWVATNLGSELGNCMPSLNYSTEHGLMVVYGDRGTGNMMITLNNDVNDIIANPVSYNTPQILFTVGAADDFQPLGYGSIKRVAQSRFMIHFSEELTSTTTAVYMGDGSLENYVSP